MGQYTTSMRAYRALLSKEMALASWTEIPFWAQFIGHIGNDKGRYPRSVAMGSSSTKRLKPTGKPIEVLTNFQHEGGSTMDIPVAYPLTDKPVYGDKQLLGTEEARKIGYKAARVNQMRKGVKVRDGLMSEQQLKKPEVQKELMTTAQMELTDFCKRWGGYQPYNATFRRYSENVYDTAANGGLAVTQQSHPNFYVAGQGKATWSDTAATYEANVVTALQTLTDTSTDYFGTATIETAVYYASKLKIRPVQMGNGVEAYCMVINPSQAIQLIRDTKWLDANKYAGPRDEMQNRLFTGLLLGIYRGVYIYVDQNIPGARYNGLTGFSATYSTTLTTAGVMYGQANPLATPIDDADRKLAILFGQSFVACGYASPLGFEQEDWDYGNKKTEGCHMIVGYERADIYDHDGYFTTAGYFYENHSSLVVATYSPDAVAW